MKENILQLSEIKISYQPKIKSSDRLKITGSKDAAKAFRQVWSHPLELKECFYALYLNRSNLVLGYLLVSVGGISGTVVDVRNVLQTALKANACSIVLAHNHPSGNLEPSDADKKITRQLKEAAAIMEAPVVDHLIITQSSYFSFADEGLL